MGFVFALRRRQRFGAIRFNDVALHRKNEEPAEKELAFRRQLYQLYKPNLLLHVVHSSRSLEGRSQATAPSQARYLSRSPMYHQPLAQAPF